MTKTLCNRCHNAIRAPGQRWCHGCRAAYMRKWQRNRTAELHRLRRIAEKVARETSSRGTT